MMRYLLYRIFFWTCAILTKYTCRVLTNMHHFDILNPPLFWHLYMILTNLHHLTTEFDEKSEDIFFVVCQVTSWNFGQSKQSEFTVLLSILRYVTELDIVIVTFSFCSINCLLRSIFRKNLYLNLSRVLGSKVLNEYRWQSKSNQSEVKRLMTSLRYSLE